MTFLAKKTARSVPLVPLTPETLKRLPAATQKHVAAAGWSAAPGTHLALTDKVLVGVRKGLMAYADLPQKLPKHAAGYYIDAKLDKETATQAALGWALGSYQFTRYKTSKVKDPALLVWPEKADRKAVEAAAAATFLVRDLVNTPASDMGPAELETAAKKIKGARVRTVSGKALEKEYPMIHAVGKGSPRAPRLIDLRWGNAKHPKVTLVGKGVVFDTGGLDIKPASAMLLMKKDMGGGAHALALAQMIIAHKLPVSLRVLVPAVENAVDGLSFRPTDVLQSRQGLTVEVGDTDAEGRLVLADALAEACRDKPKLILDFATLTGAARVALGPELPALFSNDDRLARDILDGAEAAEDPLWRLPLWQPYKDGLASKVADTNSVGGGSFGGAITAALFLEKFVAPGQPWAHIDTYAWTAARPGRPEGGEALGLRAAFEMLKNRFA